MERVNFMTEEMAAHRKGWEILSWQSRETTGN
jgi:hypothetical protein